jgi:drug/metabolite transporter (DMT)-like permease
MMGYALAACISYGAADFLGGLTVRRQSVAATLLIGQSIAFIVSSIGALLTPGYPNWSELTLGFLAGTVSGAGMPLFYRSLAQGTMARASALLGIMYAAVPVIAGRLFGNHLTLLQSIGLVFAVLAIYVLKCSHHVPQGQQSGALLAMPMLAGCAFGLYHVLISRTTPASGLWPLVAARAALLGGVMMYVIVRPPECLVSRWAGLSAVAALLGVGATILAFMAVHGDHLSIAGMLIALSPAVTTVLARVFLHERLERNHIVGLLMSLVAIGCIVA